MKAEMKSWSGRRPDHQFWTGIPESYSKHRIIALKPLGTGHTDQRTPILPFGTIAAGDCLDVP